MWRPSALWPFFATPHGPKRKLPINPADSAPRRVVSASRPRTQRTGSTLNLPNRCFLPAATAIETRNLPDRDRAAQGHPPVGSRSDRGCPLLAQPGPASTANEARRATLWPSPRTGHRRQILPWWRPSHEAKRTCTCCGLAHVLAPWAPLADSHGQSATTRCARMLSGQMRTARHRGCLSFNGRCSDASFARCSCCRDGVRTRSRGRHR